MTPNSLSATRVEAHQTRCRVTPHRLSPIALLGGRTATALVNWRPCAGFRRKELGHFHGPGARQQFESRRYGGSKLGRWLDPWLSALESSGYPHSSRRLVSPGSSAWKRPLWSSS